MTPEGSAQVFESQCTLSQVLSHRLQHSHPGDTRIFGALLLLILDMRAACHVFDYMSFTLCTVYAEVLPLLSPGVKEAMTPQELPYGILTEKTIKQLTR